LNTKTRKQNPAEMELSEDIVESGKIWSIEFLVWNKCRRSQIVIRRHTILPQSKLEQCRRPCEIKKINSLFWSLIPTCVSEMRIEYPVMAVASL
jgi:hypothetical protein